MSSNSQSQEDFYVGASISSFHQTPFPYGRVGELFHLKKTELKVILYLYHLANINKHRPVIISGRKLALRIGGHRNTVINALNSLSAPVANIGSDKVPWVIKTNKVHSVYKLKITHGHANMEGDSLSPEFFGLHPSLFKLITNPDVAAKSSLKDPRVAALSLMERDSILSLISLSLLRYQFPATDYSFSAEEFLTGLTVGTTKLPPLPRKKSIKSILRIKSILNTFASQSLISFDGESEFYTPFPPQNIPKMLQDDPEMLQDVPKMLQDVPKMLQDDIPKMLQDDPEMLQDVPKMLQDDPEMLQDVPKMLHYNCTVEYSKTLLYSTQLLVTKNGWLSIEDKYLVKTDVSLDSVLIGIADRSSPRNYNAYIAGMHRKASIGIVVNPAKDTEPQFEGLDITSFVNHFLAERHSTIDTLSRRTFQALNNGDDVTIHSNGVVFTIKKGSKEGFAIVGFETGKKELALSPWLASLKGPYLQSSKQKTVVKPSVKASLVETLEQGKQKWVAATFLNLFDKGGKLDGVLKLKKGSLCFIAEGVEKEVGSEANLLANYTWSDAEVTE